MEKFNYGLEQLYIYAEGVYVRGPTHVCTKDFAITFPKKPVTAFTPPVALPLAKFVADGLPSKHNVKQTCRRVDRNLYRPTR